MKDIIGPILKGVGVVLLAFFGTVYMCILILMLLAYMLVFD